MTRLCALISLVLLASCVSPSRAPTPAPRPPEPRPIARPQPPAPPPLDWTLRPTTPGDWRLQTDVNATAALFDGPAGRFGLICDRISRRIRLDTADTASPRTTIRATSTARTLTALELAANDPLLDAIAYTRGRFMVERDGAAALILPAYAEVARVIDDCRG